MALDKLVFYTCSLFAPIIHKEDDDDDVKGHNANINININDKCNSSSSSSSSSSSMICSVCLSRMKEGDNVRVLPCMHEYHRECVDRWLMTGGGGGGGIRRKTCPLCRFAVEIDQDSRTHHHKVTAVLTEEMLIWFSSFHIAGL